MSDDPSPDVRTLLASAATRASASAEQDTRAPLRPSVVIGALSEPGALTFSDEETLVEGDLDGNTVELGLHASRDRFVPEGQVGRGGMGVVVRAWDTELRRRVALKWLRDDIRVGRTQLLRFLAEAQLTAQLDHPGIVPVHDIGITAEGRLFYVMKLVEGQTLGERIADLHRGRPTDASARRLVAALLRAMDAVDYAHSRGVIHRDLKPANLILGSYGEVWVVDWGIAHVSRPEELDVRPDRVALDPTRPGVVIGTPSYSSPEQLVGDPIDARSDVFSLGSVLFEILTGSAPLAGMEPLQRLNRLMQGPPDPRGVGRDVPDGLARICMRALRADPDERYASVRELATAVEEWLERERQREEDLAGWVVRELHLSALAVDARAVRISDALSHLVSLSQLLLSTEATDEAVADWLAAEGFEVDADGYHQPRELAPSIRQGRAPPDALSWCWPPSRAQDPIARRHMYLLRRIGPTLRDMADRVAEVSFWYFADARNVAVVFPADDMKAAVPPEFDFLSYPAFVAAAPERNPDRVLRATPPHVDYGNKGLITAMTRPVYVDGAFCGVWAADVPLNVLHADVDIAEDERELTFIVDREGLVIAHPRDPSLARAEKGAVFDTRLGDLGGVLAGLDPAAMFAEGVGSRRLQEADGRELIVRFQAAPKVGWLICHVTKGAEQV